MRKRLALLIPTLYVGGVLLGLVLLDPETSSPLIVLAFVILAGGAIGFSHWFLRKFSQQEAETQQRSEQLMALHQAALALTQELDLAMVLQQVVDQARTLARAKYGALGVLDENGEFIDQFITSGITPEQRARLGAPPRGHGLLGALIKAGKSIRIPSIGADSRSVGFPSNHPPMHSLLGVPIKFKSEILGDLYLTDKTEPSGRVTVFSDEDQDFLEMFASQAAIAIKNAQLYRQSQQLTLLQERDRFGMDLHDGVIQSIYAIGLMLEDAKHRTDDEPDAVNAIIARTIERLNRVIRDIRNYILDLRPQRFQGRNLPEGLEELAREVRAHSFLSVSVQVESEDWLQLPPERTVEILQIAREALTNVQKHSRASQVEITLKRVSESLSLAINDNGIGFDNKQLLNDKGYGLHNMRERAQALEGEIIFARREPGGMRIELKIPLLP